MNELSKTFNGLMKKYFRQSVLLGHTTATTAEEYFGFDHSQVETIHFHKAGVGSGVWFRLVCGSVVDEIAKPACRDSTLYDHARRWS